MPTEIRTRPLTDDARERILAVIDEHAEGIGLPFDGEHFQIEAWDGGTWLGGLTGRTHQRWFYVELLGAFPDIHFDLTDIVIGPQGVCEEARVTGTHEGSWLGAEPTGERLRWNVVIFFPWDRERRLFRGEKVYVDSPELTARFKG